MRRIEMLRALKSFLGFRPDQSDEPAITIDYSLQPMIPSEAKRILCHQPADSGVFSLLPGSLGIEEFLPGTTYAQYRRDHINESLGDAVILDAIVNQLQSVAREPAKFERLIQKYFGSFSGQVFFLGTTYESVDGRECVPFLNINTMYPSLRYICPANQIINYDVTCCACHLYQPSSKRVSAFHAHSLTNNSY